MVRTVCKRIRCQNLLNPIPRIRKNIERKTKTLNSKKEKISDVNNTDVNKVDDNTPNYQILLLLIFVIAAITLAFTRSNSLVKNKRSSDDSKDEDIISDSLMRMFKSRRDYYRDVYLKSDAWKRKRYVVLKRDNWRCVYCGKRATQVHHKKYAKKNIGKEPIECLSSPVAKPN